MWRCANPFCNPGNPLCWHFRMSLEFSFIAYLLFLLFFRPIKFTKLFHVINCQPHSCKFLNILNNMPFLLFTLHQSIVTFKLSALHFGPLMNPYKTWNWTSSIWKAFRIIIIKLSSHYFLFRTITFFQLLFSTFLFHFKTNLSNSHGQDN